MSTMMSGAIAGAVGTMALDVTSYADMALRARSSSNLPAEVVKRMSQRAGVPIENDNRATALGALSGYAVGVGVGMVYGVLRTRIRRAPLAIAALALGAAAMAAADVPAARVGATDLKKWGVMGWLSDVIPHMAYGLVTAAVFDAVSHRNGQDLRLADAPEVLEEVSAVVVEIDDLSSD